MMRRQRCAASHGGCGIRFEDKLYGLSNYDFESAYHAMNGLRPAGLSSLPCLP